jgi:hypothetical protein
MSHEGGKHVERNEPRIQSGGEQAIASL